jgi:hypothetical protein
VLTVFGSTSGIIKAGDSRLVLKGAQRDPVVARVASFLNRYGVPSCEEHSDEPQVLRSNKPFVETRLTRVKAGSSLCVKHAPASWPPELRPDQHSSAQLCSLVLHSKMLQAKR